jgi:hypothetical protein
VFIGNLHLDVVNQGLVIDIGLRSIRKIFGKIQFGQVLYL